MNPLREHELLMTRRHFFGRSAIKSSREDSFHKWRDILSLKKQVQNMLQGSDLSLEFFRLEIDNVE